MSTRRRFLAQAARGAALAGLAGVIERARAIAPQRLTGTLRDVRHVVVLTQENRAFDHLFGALPGVRGFGDPFPLPTPGGGTVWKQPRQDGQGWLAPYRADTRAHAALLRLEGTAHTWPDAQSAWDHGRMARWTATKHDHSLAYYAPDDLPFHTALADAFTLCDAYHCSFFGGTHPNRYFLNTGTVDPEGHRGGPALYNDMEDFGKPEDRDGYGWTTYAERLQAAGIGWTVYQVIGDNFDDNALAGFRRFRDAVHGRSGHAAVLRERAASSGGLERLRNDVLADRLPQVSWIIGPSEGSEHPWQSSPAQGAAYIARVLEALTARPEVWARTVLFVNYDENDGYFDHLAPPAVPSVVAPGLAAGASTVSTGGEYAASLARHHHTAADVALLGRPLGLGPRVPMFVVSPWSRGGWVCSEVFDHTSVIRFLEARFGVPEPNISPWRRTVCGDLTSAFDFRGHDATPASAGLPPTQAEAERARALKDRTTPLPPVPPAAPVQATGTRPARAVPQALAAAMRTGTGGRIGLSLVNTARRGAVVHVMDRLRLDALPRRYTLASQTRLAADWPLADIGTDGPRYDLWLLAVNGWHRHFAGTAAVDEPQADLHVDAAGRHLVWRLHNPGTGPLELVWRDLAYGEAPHTLLLPAGGRRALRLALPAHRWYDQSLSCAARPGWLRRAAGHAETGRPSLSDPAMHGPALLEAWRGGATRRG